MPNTHHTRLLIICIAVLSALAGCLGVYLVIIGYNADLLLMCVPSAITGMFGMLSQRSHQHGTPAPTDPEITKTRTP